MAYFLLLCAGLAPTAALNIRSHQPEAFFQHEVIEPSADWPEWSVLVVNEFSKLDVITQQLVNRTLALLQASQAGVFRANESDKAADVALELFVSECEKQIPWRAGGNIVSDLTNKSGVMGQQNSFFFNDMSAPLSVSLYVNHSMEELDQFMLEHPAQFGDSRFLKLTQEALREWNTADQAKAEMLQSFASFSEHIAPTEPLQTLMDKSFQLVDDLKAHVDKMLNNRQELDKKIFALEGIHQRLPDVMHLTLLSDQQLLAKELDSYNRLARSLIRCMRKVNVRVPRN